MCLVRGQKYAIIRRNKPEREFDIMIHYKIIRNAIRCNLCGDEIESTHCHDFVQCSCGACAVDGGHEYLRRCFRSRDCFTELSETEPPLEEKK